MGLLFFADHCISNTVIESLDQAGHDVFRLRNHIPPDSPDPEVISKAQEFNTILITLNGDFSDIITYPPENYLGIIALQVRNHPEVTSHIIARLLTYLSAHSDMAHYRGKLFLVESHRIRVRG